MDATERSATQFMSKTVPFEVQFAAGGEGCRRMYMSPTRSPLRAMVTDTRPLLEGVPFTVCWMFSIAKFVWRLYTAWKKVTLG